MPDPFQLNGILRMTQWLWRAFQTAAFFGFLMWFSFNIPHDQQRPGAMVMICGALTAIATAVVFWIGRLLLWLRGVISPGYKRSAERADLRSNRTRIGGTPRIIS